MPGNRLDPDNKAELPKFSVVGVYAAAHGSAFIQHVALLREKSNVAFGDEVAVWHTAPPILAGKRTCAGAPDEFNATIVHAIAYLEDLTADEMQGIETSLVNIDSQTPLLSSTRVDSIARVQAEGYRVHYTAHPAVQWIRDEKTGRRRYRKFSCSGFVVECYRGAGIILVDCDREKLPEVDLPTLRQGYGEWIDNPRIRSRVGLAGTGPWRLVLAGYVLHSLTRESNIVRKESFCPSDKRAADFPAS